MATLLACVLSIGLLGWTTARGAGLAFVERFGRPVSAEGTGLAFSPDEGFLYASPSFPFDLEVLKVDPTTKIPHFASAAGAEDYYYGGIVVSPDGKHVYAGTYPNRPPPRDVYAFARDAATGALTPIDEDEVSDGYGMAISPDGLQLYVPGDDQVTVFARDATTGVLTLLQTLVDGQDGVSGLGSFAAATITADGAHVYVTGSSVGSIVVFARDGLAGTLSFVAAYVDGLGGSPTSNTRNGSR